MGAREVIKVAVGDVEVDPAQPRSHFSQDSLLALAKTMEAGQVQPILAYRTQENKLRILDGERRWRATKLSGKQTVDVVIVEAPASPHDALERQLLANLHEDLPPIDYARAVERLIEATGMSAGQVAMRLGTSPASVSRALSLLKLTPELQESVQRGDISRDAGYQISRATDPSEQGRLAELVAQKGFTRDAVASKVKSRQPSAKAKRAGSARAIAKLGGGRTITLVGAGLESIDRVIEWLEELLTKARKARPRGMELSTFLALLRDEAKAAGHDKPMFSGVLP